MNYVPLNQTLISSKNLMSFLFENQILLKGWKLLQINTRNIHTFDG